MARRLKGGGARVSHVGTRRNTPGETKFRMCSMHVVLYSVMDKYLYGLVRTS